MNRLLEMQTAFQKAMDDEREKFHPYILETDAFPRTERIAVYAEGYLARLVESLETDYPKLKILLGHERFAALAESYVKKKPSMVRSLRWYGTDFSDWILDESGVKKPAFIAELAKFEMVLAEAFDAKDQKLLTLEDVASLPPEEWPNLYLKAQDCVKLFVSHYNSVATWQSIKLKKRPKPIQKLAEAVSWQISRRQQETLFRSLTAHAAWGLQMIIPGISFADLCSGLCDFVPEELAALEAATLLKTWIHEEVLISS